MKEVLLIIFIVGALSLIYENPAPIYRLLDKLHFADSANAWEFLGFRKQDDQVAATLSLRAYQRSTFP